MLISVNKTRIMLMNLKRSFYENFPLQNTSLIVKLRHHLLDEKIIPKPTLSILFFIPLNFEIPHRRLDGIEVLFQLPEVKAGIDGTF